MNRSLNLLILDDNPDDRSFVIREMKKEFPELYVEQAKNQDEFLRALKEGRFELVITDYDLHWSDGLAVLRAVKGRHADCPVIMFTGTGSEEIAVEAMKEGLDDYIIKSVHQFGRLRSAVRAVLERARQKQALRASEEDFRKLIKASPVAMGVYDDLGNITFLNDKFINIFGYTIEDIPTMDLWWQEAYPQPAYRQRAMDIWQNASEKARLEGTDIEPHRFRVTTKAGTVRVIEIYGANIGRKHLVILDDVTELKFADEQLLLMAAIVESSDDAIMCIDMSDMSGVVSSWNKGAEKIYGYSRYEMIGSSIKLIFPPGAEAELSGVFEKIVRGEHIEHYETKCVNKYGKMMDVSLTISPILDDERKVTRASVIGSDITHLVSLEGQLRQAQKMEALGTLAGGVAHDFNNILTAIIGHATLLDLKIGKDEPLAANVHQILEAASRASTLTQALLGFSRKRPIETKAVNLNDIIKKVERLLVMLLKENVDFQSTLSPQELIIMADSGQIEQILINLATNARDVIGSSGAVRVSTDRVELDEMFIKVHGYGKPGWYASLSFSDNGSGMEEQTRLRIFEPFFTTKEAGKGTGLGLSIVYSIVKQHNGYITCYSERGKGTTFQIYLPLTESAWVEEWRMPEAAPRGGTETILVAEDDVATRRLDREVLEGYGYSVIEAVDGEDAIAKFLEHRDEIRLLFLDSIMPKKNGREVYDEIMKIAPDLKVLFTSGYAADTFSDLQLAEQDFIAKPILPTMLLNKVRKVLDAEPKK